MKRITTILSLIVLMVYACGPSLESENKNWAENLEKIENLKTEYPVYATLIDKKLEEAKQEWAASESITEEEAKLEKMVAANDLLEKGCVGNLLNMKSKVSNLKTKKIQLAKLKVKDFALEKNAKKAIKNADNAVYYADKVMFKEAEEYTIEGAPAEINYAFSALENSLKEVNSMINKIKKKNKPATTSDNKKKKKKKS